jgi:uncharacterized membrane protein (DUF373 family)
VLTLFILNWTFSFAVGTFASTPATTSPIIDAGIAFVLRHIMIDLFNHKLDTNSIYALSVLLLALGAIRVGLSVNYHREKTSTDRAESDRPVKQS